MQKEEKDKIKKEIIEKVKREIRKEDDSPGELFIPGGVLGGMGFGFLFGNFLAGLFIGLGAGFVLFAVYEMFKKSRREK